VLYMIWEELLSLIFPERCIGCDRVGSVLCAICERTITMKPQALSGTTAALFDYKHPLVKKAIWALKYHRKRALGRYFGNALYREFFKQLARSGRHAHEEIILLPVPASKKAIAMRGYNHAAIIASAIVECGKSDNIPISLERDILYKKRENPQQVKSRGRAAREQNVLNIFGIREGEMLRGKTVILIDDVITTGATINAARSAVKEFKPKRVLAIAAAH
jgi:ComF family protein